MKKSEILKILNEEIDLALIPESADQSHRLTEAKIKKGDVIKMDDGEYGVVNKVKGRVAYIKLPSMPGSFHPIEADRTTYKGKHKGKDLYTEASAKDKFGAPPMNKWWTGDKDALMSAIYHAQRQLPPKTYAEYQKNWKSIVNQLQQKYPAPANIYKKKLNEAKLPKRFTVKTKQTIDGTIYSPGDYALKKKRAGGGIYLNMDKGEMLGVDARNIATLEEGTLTEKLASGLKPLLTLGSKVSWKTMSEDALLDLSDMFDKIDDEVAEDVASYLNMAIENKQDGKQGLATKALKAFNKACKDALAGKPVKSVFEGKLTEAAAELDKLKDAIKMFQDKIKKQGRITNARDEEHLKNLIALYKKMGGKGIKEGKLTEHDGEGNMAKHQAMNMDTLEEAVSPKKAAEVLFDKLAAAKLIGKQNRRRAVGVIEYMLSRMNFSEGINEGKLNEMDINDPILVAIRARKTDLKKKAALPKVKKISTKQYYKLMDAEIDLIDQMKDAAKEYQRLDSEMNQEAGQKGDAWTDADANRYGGDLNKLQTKIEKLAKQKLAIKKQIMNYRIN